jgi:hypothetical protein
MLATEIIAAIIELMLLAGIGVVLAEAATRPGPPPPSRTRERAGDILMGLAIAVFFLSGVTKLMHLPFAMAEMGVLRLTGWKLDLVAGVELTSGALLVYRPLRSLALLFNSAHCGGAIVAHLAAGQEFAAVPSAVILSLVWLGAFLRHPEVLWSLSQDAAARAARPAARGLRRRRDAPA